jgi:hypothetical protein
MIKDCESPYDGRHEGAARLGQDRHFTGSVSQYHEGCTPLSSSLQAVQVGCRQDQKPQCGHIERTGLTLAPPQSPGPSRLSYFLAARRPPLNVPARGPPLNVAPPAVAMHVVPPPRHPAAISPPAVCDAHGAIPPVAATTPGRTHVEGLGAFGACAVDRC